MTTETEMSRRIDRVDALAGDLLDLYGRVQSLDPAEFTAVMAAMVRIAQRQFENVPL